MEPTLLVMDSVQFLCSLEPESVDLAITDPAYESLEKHRKRGTTTRLKKSTKSSNAWFPIFPNDRFPEFFAQMYRVLKKRTHLYLVCDQDTMWVVRGMAEAAGFRYWKFLVWRKLGRIGLGYHYRGAHELVMFFEKGTKPFSPKRASKTGERQLNDPSVSDVLDIQKIYGGYPTSKPTELATVLIGQSSNEGDLVIDPFMGSGFVASGADQLKRRFAGCDINPACPDLVRERIRQESLMFGMGRPWLPSNEDEEDELEEDQ